MSGHSLTVRETISVCTTEINGAVAYEVSGNTFHSFILLSMNWNSSVYQIIKMVEIMAFLALDWSIIRQGPRWIASL